MFSREDMTQEQTQIVRLTPDQWKEYKELRLRALEREPQAFATQYAKDAAYPDTKWKERLAAVGNGKSWTLFAQDTDGKLVGMVGGYRDENDLQNHSAQIWGVYVDKEVRGRGLAKALMKGIIDELETDSDIQTIILEVNTDQASAAKLYERMGFVTVGEPYPHLMGDGEQHQITKMVKTR